MKSKAIPLCSHTLPSGRTCAMPASRGSRFCYHHDPDRPKPLRAFAASLEPLDSITGLYRLLDDTMRQLLQGKPDARRARAVVATVRECLMIQATQLRGLDILCQAATDRVNRTPD